MRCCRYCSSDPFETFLHELTVLTVKALPEDSRCDITIARDVQTPFVKAFAQEVRRFYPFVPFIGGRAVKDLSWRGHQIRADSLVLLDIYGQNHDPSLWKRPYTFDPQRFVSRQIGAFDLIPQGGGDPRSGHRCPGETITVALLRVLTTRLARLDYDVPTQDLTISLRRIPARPKIGFVLTLARPARSRALTLTSDGERRLRQRRGPALADSAT